MTKLIYVGFMMLATLPALAQEVSGTEDAPAADAATANVESDEVAETAKSESKSFVPPPGFKIKKQGNMTLYCKKDSTVGTRFKTEKCFSEDQVREYLLALEIQKRDIDRIRSTCATGAVCAPQ